VTLPATGAPVVPDSCRIDDASVRLDTTVVVDGLAFGESPRWHDDRLWFADYYDRAVFSLGQADNLVREADVPQQPGGLGWLADGRMLVVSRLDRRVLRRETDGTLVEHADLSHLVRGDCNDMVVDRQGRAFVGEYGFDLYEWFGSGGGFDDAPTGTLICVQPDGTSETACTGLRLPNGAVVTDDGVLIVAETFAARLSADRLRHRRGYR
jgi:sugar lactone lactonase YvrE